MSAKRTTGRLARSLARTAELASTRFPVTALLVLLFSVLANAEVAGRSLVPTGTLGWWLAALYSAAAASVFAKLLMERRGIRPLIAQSVSLAAAVIVGTVMRYALPLGIFAPALVAAVSLAVPLGPYAFRPDDRRFWTFTLWSGVGVALAFVSVLLFSFGVLAILEMVRFLFSVDLRSRAYAHIYMTALTLVGPLIALGRIPSDFEERVSPANEDRMTAGVRLLFDWLAAPLALATAVILHLYAAKILSLGELPRNQVGWIVTSFLLLVLSLRIGADPFLAGGRFFSRLFARAWAAMLVVPLGLLAVALAQRVAPEGWTLERYYLALGALAGALVLAAQIVPIWRGRIRLIAAIPLVLLALSSFGPLGVRDTVGRSQAARLQLFLSSENSTVPIAESGRREARSRIAALEKVGELDRAVGLLPEARRADLRASLAKIGSAEDGASARSLDLVTSAYGLNMPDPKADRTFRSSGRPPLVTAGFDVALLELSVRPGSASGTDAARISFDRSELQVEIGAARDRFPLAPIVDAVPPNAFDNPGSSTPPIDVTLASTSGKVLRLNVQGLTVDSEKRIVRMDATLLLRRQDWPGAPLFGGDPAVGAAEPRGAVGEGAR